MKANLKSIISLVIIVAVVLVASSLLVFGRFGWLGKIAGAVLGMMLIGNNAHVSQSQSIGQNNQASEQTTNQSGGMRR